MVEPQITKKENAAEIKRRTGREIQITHVGTRRPRPDLNLEGIQQMMTLWTSYVNLMLMSWLKSWVAFILPMKSSKAIKHGKQVVTAIKALLAEHGNELFKRLKIMLFRSLA